LIRGIFTREKEEEEEEEKEEEEKEEEEKEEEKEEEEKEEEEEEKEEEEKEEEEKEEEKEGEEKEEGRWSPLTLPMGRVPFVCAFAWSKGHALASLFRKGSLPHFLLRILLLLFLCRRLSPLLRFLLLFLHFRCLPLHPRLPCLLSNLFPSQLLQLQ